MSQANRILLIDDGELSNVARILTALGLEHTRIRGQQVVGMLAPPSELLITTSRCAQLVRRGSPPEASSGRPVRIIGIHENSSAMRRTLRRIGYDLLVGLPGKDEVWQPLIHRATYRGEERRQSARIVVGSPVTVSPGGPEFEEVAATLIEISNRSCRLITAWKPETGDDFELTLPKATTASKALTVGGHVVRVSDGPGRDSHTLTLSFDSPMSAQIRTELSGVVKLWSVGPPVSSTGGAESALKKPPHAYPVPVEVDRDKAPSVRVQVEILGSRGPK